MGCSGAYPWLDADGINCTPIPRITGKSTTATATATFTFHDTEPDEVRTMKYLYLVELDSVVLTPIVSTFTKRLRTRMRKFCERETRRARVNFGGFAMRLYK